MTGWHGRTSLNEKNAKLKLTGALKIATIKAKKKRKVYVKVSEYYCNIFQRNGVYYSFEKFLISSPIILLLGIFVNCLWILCNCSSLASSTSKIMPDIVHLLNLMCTNKYCYNECSFVNASFRSASISWVLSLALMKNCMYNFSLALWSR